MDVGWHVSYSPFPLFSLMGAEDNSGYFNQVWVQCGQSSLMGAEWCMDYVKGSLLTDETASLPGRVQANRTLTQSGRRSTSALLCFPLIQPVCKKHLGILLMKYRGQHIWQSPRYSLAELWPDCSKQLLLLLFLRRLTRKTLIWDCFNQRSLWVSAWQPHYSRVSEPIKLTFFCWLCFNKKTKCLHCSPDGWKQRLLAHMLTSWLGLITDNFCFSDSSTPYHMTLFLKQSHDISMYLSMSLKY